MTEFYGSKIFGDQISIDLINRKLFTLSSGFTYEICKRRETVMVKNPKINTVLSHRHELYITGYKIFHGLDLYEAEREFIGRALCMIGKGHDPGEALQSKAKRGENVGTQATYIEKRNRIVVSLIKNLRKSINKKTGKKMTLEAAIMNLRII